MTDDTWLARDLPVLQAIVETYDRTGRTPRPSEIAARTGFDEETVERQIAINGYRGTRR